MLQLEQIKPFTLLLTRPQCEVMRVIQTQALANGHLDLTVADPQGYRRDLHFTRENEAGLQLLPADSPHMLCDPEAIRACLLGGAVGDALGAPVEFMHWQEIKREFGKAGIRDYATAYGQLGSITDDTQMMLFTAEGLLRACVRSEAHGICHPPSVIHHALLRWLLTQSEKPVHRSQEGNPELEIGNDGWLFQERRLWSRRAPGNTCIGALRQSRHFGDLARNDSKGCGGVMRVAPCAFFSNPFETAADSARMSHGHPSGYLAAGLFADILSRMWRHCQPPLKALQESLQEHGDKPCMDETRKALEQILLFYRQGIAPTPQRIEAFGGGWVAEEALAIGLWCALFAENFADGIALAVNHSGDSDSTGLITGHFLGLVHGVTAIPVHLLDQLELRDVIERIAQDLSYVPYAYSSLDEGETSAAIWERYPGW